MDAVVPPEITAELTQILSNLVLGDNEIRSNAEKAVNDRLEHTPELYLLALAQFAITADTDVMRSFSLVLLRRLLFRTAPNAQAVPANPTRPAPRLTLYDHLSANTLNTLERLLLHSLSHEPTPLVRRKTVDTICDLANQGMSRGRPWHALQAQAFNMTQINGGEASNADMRESAYRLFAGCPNLVMDLQTDAVIGVFQRGLQDAFSIDVRHASLIASVAYLQAAEPAQLAQSLSLLYPMLETLPNLAQTPHPSSSAPKSFSDQSNYQHLTKFLQTLTPLCSTHPLLFAPHLQGLQTFLPALILPQIDCGPTPTVGRPFPSSGSGAGPRQGSAFVFPPPGQTSLPSHEEAPGEDDERTTLRLSALEFMVSLSEARPPMVKKMTGWVDILVRACLEGMGEFDDEGGRATQEWLADDPSTSATTESESTPAVFEQSLDRLACALGGRAVLPPAFQHIPSMMASYDWRMRHAGLMAIAAIGEGTGKVMQNELEQVVNLVVPMFKDTHPRVRHAACQCVGQLCTDLEEVIQELYHQQLFSVLIPALEDPEARVHSHAAAALINFCEGVERDTLLPYLDPIVERLLKLLNPDGDQSQVRRYVQEQAITTLAMVADASEAPFAKHYASIMPLLLNVLQNAEGPTHNKLRAKAMECAGLIAIAVGRDVFRPDATKLVELLMRIQQSHPDQTDAQLSYYLIATWSKVCQAMGPEFEPYLPVVMPSLLTTASAKADISVYEEDEERDGWETVSVDGQVLGIRTSAIEEKCQAFETLVIYCSTLGARFAPYLAQTLELALPSLKFYFHEGVREACAMLIPMLVSCGKTSGTLTNQMVSATFHQLIHCIKTEHDSSFLASLYKCFTDSLRTLEGVQALPQEFIDGIVEATSQQLQLMAEKRKVRASKSVADIENEKEDIALLEEIEEFALEDMTKMLVVLDPNHRLLVAISSVKALGFNQWDAEEDEES
ncbi:ARM repeat-containing protein [Pluteus cervinus]|uniref:ARM repeat-containing protein n=1 Tax=Pluteus cervinus TaxID=181527 RepID=A0ACD3AVK8_9AGAR|nr:ARM repeat-containing protein [Pluteus cervinus]